jgi:hypothetical protein
MPYIYIYAIAVRGCSCVSHCAHAAQLQVAKVLAEYREGIWDSAARDPNDEMIRGNETNELHTSTHAIIDYQRSACFRLFSECMACILSTNTSAPHQ